MSAEVRALEPQALWNHFADLNEVPRPSKQEERVIAFMKAFGEGLGLETMVDKVGNVIIRKAASDGMEDKSPVILQSHIDMVHQKNADTEFDFSSEGIRMLVEEDWVRADGTTLGADNGIGVASIMTILASSDIAHPPLEALFTIDEETGMTGAMALEGGVLQGKFLLNLDTEDDTELTIGCAGGVDITAKGKFVRKPTPKKGKSFQIGIKGLTGGHSGMEIHLGRGNANKLMNRFLLDASKAYGLRIHLIDGGGLRNAIPRESFATVWVPKKKVKAFHKHVEAYEEILLAEYRSTDPDLQVLLEETKSPKRVVGKKFQDEMLRSIYACPNGIYRMSPDVDGLVQTSNNLARVEVKKGKYQIMCLCRGSVNSEKMDEADAITSSFELMGAKVSQDGSYPGWAPNPDSAIVKLMDDLYKEMYQKQADVNACHAGLECGSWGKIIRKSK